MWSKALQQNHAVHQGKHSSLNDSVDEPGSRITATVGSGAGYTLHSSGASASADVNDNDDPAANTPLIRVISSTISVTEGGDVTFYLIASPAPASDISITVQVTQTGDFAVSGQTGQRSVAMVVADGSYVEFTVGTENDNVFELDGSITATVLAGTGYAPQYA